MSLALAFAFTACESDSDPIEGIQGTLTIGSNSSGGAYYVYLDDDADPALEYGARVIGELDPGQTSVSYSLDTSTVPAGSYYLYAGYDSESTTNMDPLNPGWWEKIGWYGSENFEAPVSRNVTELDGIYDITLHDLP